MEDIKVTIDDGNIMYGSLTIGTTSTGKAGTEAKVTNTGTDYNAILNFTIPKGDKGDKGEQGEKGDTGEVSLQIFNNAINELNNKDKTMQSQISGLTSGSPLAASSTDEMTDTTKLYVNTTDGQWYYYDGTAWVSGGTYLGDLTNLENMVVMPNLLKIKTRNLFDSLVWYELKTVTPTSTTTIYNILDNLTDSQYAHISEVIQIKHSNGVPIIKNGDLVFNTLNQTSGIIFEFDVNGNYLRTLTGAATGFSEDAYYVVFKQYVARANHWNILVKPQNVEWVNFKAKKPLFEENVSSNFFDYLEWHEGKNIVTPSNYAIVNIFNYDKALTDSEVASVSKPIQIKDFEGEKIIDIENLIFDNKNTSAIICYLFDENGNYLSKLLGTDSLVIPNECYYMIFIKYNNINNTIIVPTKKIEWLEKVYEVGADKEYTNLMDLFKLLKDDKTEKTIKIYSGVYDIFAELARASFINSIDTSVSTAWDYWSTFVPENTKLIGIGDVVLEFNPYVEGITAQVAGFLSPLNIRGNVEIENIKINATNCRYAIHNETGYQNKYNNMYHKYKNVTAKYTLGEINPSPSGQAFGCGFEVGNNYEFDNCSFETTKTTIHAFSMHNRNVTSTTDGTNIVMNNCICKTPTNTQNSMAFINLHTGTVKATNLVKLANCYTNGKIKLANDGTDSTIYNSFKLELLNSKYSDIVIDDDMNNELTPDIY